MAITSIIRAAQLHALQHRHCKLSYHAHRLSLRPHEHTACWIQTCSTPGAVQICGNWASRRWQLHNSWYIYIYRCVCVCLCARMIIQCIHGKCNINKHTHTCTHTKWGLELWKQVKFTEKCQLGLAIIAWKFKLLCILTGWPMGVAGAHYGQP